MKTLACLVFVVFVGCVGRPLESCSNGLDCAGGAWCVETWLMPDKSKEPADFICAPQCSTDADCGTGTCVPVGDGATADVEDPISFSACRLTL